MEIRWTPRPVPKFLRYLSSVVLLIAVAMIFLGGQRIGVTWDEPLHVQRINHYMQTGWYLGDGQLYHGKPAAQMTQQFVYAPATMLFLHGLCILAGVEPAGLSLGTPEAYAVRHLGIGLISFAAICATALTARLLLRRWDWALMAAAVFVSIPLWTGHSMFNLKDVPVAAGYAFATLGLAMLARKNQWEDWRLRVAAPGALASGIFIAVGTRPGMWTGMAASITSLLLCCLARHQGVSLWKRFQIDAWRYRDVLLALGAVGVALWLIDPLVFNQPLRAMWKAAFSSSGFLGVSAPLSFVPLRVLLQMPAVMLGFLGYGLFLVARILIRSGLRLNVTDTRLVLIVVQVFTLPLVAMATGASLYGDLRQLLFAVPGAALIVTYGMAAIHARAVESADRMGPPMVAAVTGLAIVLPLADQALYFPYNYAYYNPLAAVAGLSTTGEYYRGSARELAADIPAGRVVCSPEGDDNKNAMRLAHLDAWVDCAQTLSSPVAAFLPESRHPGPVLKEDQFWAITFNAGGSVPQNCELVKGLSRRILWGRLHLASLSKCERPFPVLTPGEYLFGGNVSAAFPSYELPNLGWFLPGTTGANVGIRSRGGTSTMTFSLSTQFKSHRARFNIETLQEPGAVSLKFGGMYIEPTVTPNALEFTLPRRLVFRAVQGPLTLQFQPSGPNPLELTILSLKVRPVA